MTQAQQQNGHIKAAAQLWLASSVCTRTQPTYPSNT